MSKALIRLSRMMAAVLLLVSGAAGASPYSSLYVFGDSLADSGNVALAISSCTSGHPCTSTPIPGPIIPAYPYASNRLTNGPVWTEYLAASLGLSAAPSLAGGTNFAFAGARTGPAGSAFPYSMTDQVGMFLTATSGVAPSSALYVIEGGGNDARDVLTAALGGATSVTLSAMVGAYVNNVLGMLTTLAAGGADQFLLWNIPDIGRIPYILGLDSVIPGASTSASNLVSVMNQTLALALTALPTAISDGIHVFDAYQVTDDVAANPGAFGFLDASTPCAMSQVCIDNPSTHFFWDGIHPTTAGHAVMARLALAEIPEPGTLLLMAIAVIAIAVVSRRRA